MVARERAGCIGYLVDARVKDCVIFNVAAAPADAHFLDCRWATGQSAERPMRKQSVGEQLCGPRLRRGRLAGVAQLLTSETPHEFAEIDFWNTTAPSSTA